MLPFVNAGINSVFSFAGSAVNCFKNLDVIAPNFGIYERSLSADNSPNTPMQETTLLSRRPKIVKVALFGSK